MDKFKKTISSDVMNRIRQGEVRMKPRLYYSLLSVIGLIVGVASGLVVAYASNIIFFWLRITNSSGMAYGARRNLNETLAIFPWWALVLAIISGIVAIIFIRKFGRMYRHKTSTVAIIFVLASLIIGFGVSYLNIGLSNDPIRDSPNSDRRGNQQRNLK